MREYTAVDLVNWDDTHKHAVRTTKKFRSPHDGTRMAKDNPNRAWYGEHIRELLENGEDTKKNPEPV